MTWGAFWVAYTRGAQRIANNAARTANRTGARSSRSSSTTTNVAKKEAEKKSFWERPMEEVCLIFYKCCKDLSVLGLTKVPLQDEDLLWALVSW